ncbi:DUF1659 domain-containing protein [Bacillus litorisediminis]|uniref:DUF1659 domain-containing protein n=1 Tax=Bacillus litorisediminis TaxID=2922713 RepID=UPI001FAD72D1|nr:DUF1659 domain-containing protein [Bacillus litorisediminis]
MATANLSESRIRLFYDHGLDQDGKQVLKSKSYNAVKESATADQILATAQAIATLSSVPLFSVERNDTADITA